ncbi:Panacea domain-containing protein [Thermophilibacter sp.]
MADVLSVAEYILSKTGYVSTMKLQKLAFCSNALSLVNDGVPLFPERFQAWANGPVCRELFQAHRGKFIIGPGELKTPSVVSKIDAHARVRVDKTVCVLGDYDGNDLSELTHKEAPWRDARRGCEENERCDAVISNEAIRAFYSSAECANPLFSAT